MRHILLLAVIAVMGGCKTAPTTAAIKEKPIADPLYTSKLMSGSGNRVAGPPREERMPVPQPPPMLSEPPRPEAAIRLAGER
jgi:hypothetical protein